MIALAIVVYLSYNDFCYCLTCARGQMDMT